MKQFDLKAAKNFIISEGVPFLTSAEKILSRFGGTYFIRYENRNFGKNRPSELTSVVLAHFDAQRAMEQTDSLWFEHYAQRIGKNVSPVGICGQGHAILMVDEDGIIYAAFDESLGKIANSIDEAVLELTDRTMSRWESIPEIGGKNE